MQSSNTIEKMTTAPVGPLIIKNAIPTIITMMITAIYNTADTFFVSKLGTSASGAVGIIFSLMSLMQAAAFTIGMGSGSITSRALGANNMKQAGKYCSTAICFAFTAGVIFAVLGTIFNKEITMSLGATPTILPYAMDYARYIIFACPFFITSLVMNNQLRFQGRALFSMVGMTFGGVLNMFLDPLFIFVFDMGISGAAIATLISQAVSFFILLSVFITKKSTAEFSFKNVARDLKTYTNILTTGLPSLFRQGMASVASIFLNVQAAKYGAFLTGFAMTAAQTADAAVAGMAITNRVFMLLMSVGIGLGQGFQPVCGMNYGARKFDRVRESYVFLVKIFALIMLVFAVIIFIFSPEVARIFRNDEAVIKVAALAMRCQALALPVSAIIFSTNMLLQSTGVKTTAIFLSSLRQGVLFVPLVFALPHIVTLFGANPLFGVQLTQAVSDLLAASIALPFVIRFFNKLGK